MSTFKVHIDTVTETNTASNIATLVSATGALSTRITEATSSIADAQSDATLALNRIGGGSFTGFGTTYNIMENILNRADGDTGPLVTNDISDLTVPDVSNFVSGTIINQRIRDGVAAGTNAIIASSLASGSFSLGDTGLSITIG